MSATFRQIPSSAGEADKHEDNRQRDPHVCTIATVLAASTYVNTMQKRERVSQRM